MIELIKNLLAILFLISIFTVCILNGVLSILAYIHVVKKKNKCLIDVGIDKWLFFVPEFSRIKEVEKLMYIYPDDAKKITSYIKLVKFYRVFVLTFFIFFGGLLLIYALWDNFL